MTIKHTEQNISAENIGVVTGVRIDSSTGALIITKTNLYTNPTDQNHTTDTNIGSVGSGGTVISNASSFADLSYELVGADDSTIILNDDGSVANLFDGHIQYDYTNGVVIVDSSVIGLNDSPLATFDDIPDVSDFASFGDIPDVSDFASIHDVPTDVSDLSDNYDTEFTPKTHNHTASDITDIETVTLTVTYTDNSTDTLTLLKQIQNN